MDKVTGFVLFGVIFALFDQHITVLGQNFKTASGNQRSGFGANPSWDFTRNATLPGRYNANTSWHRIPAADRASYDIEKVEIREVTDGKPIGLTDGRNAEVYKVINDDRSRWNGREVVIGRPNVEYAKGGVFGGYREEDARRDNVERVRVVTSARDELPYVTDVRRDSDRGYYRRYESFPPEFDSLTDYRVCTDYVRRTCDCKDMAVHPREIERIVRTYSSAPESSAYRRYPSRDDIRVENTGKIIREFRSADKSSKNE